MDLQEIFLFGRFKEYKLDPVGKCNKVEKIPNTIPEIIDSISCGSEHCFFLNKTSGNMYAIGSNDHYRCGTKSKRMNTINVPTIVNNNKIGPIELVSAGGYHTLCVQRSGEVWGFGSTSNGRLGIQKLTPFTGSGPQIISFFSNLKQKVKMVAAGHYHSLILLEDNTIYSFGYGRNGQLGFPLGRNEDGCYFPRKIEYKDEKLLKSRIISVHAGRFHSALVTATGKLFTFGSNSRGQLGLGDLESRTTPTFVHFSESIRIEKFATGSDANMFISNKLDVYIFGSLTGKQILDNDMILIPTRIKFFDSMNIIDCALGETHAVVLTKSGKVYTFGCNTAGQLGNDNEDSLNPKLVTCVSKPVAIIGAGKKFTILITQSTLISDYQTKNFIKAITCKHFVDVNIFVK